MNINESIEVLKRTPAALAAMLGGLPEIWLTATEGDGKWSPYDVIGHLAHGERADWLTRARHIMDRKTEPFETFDRTAMLRSSEGKSIADLLDEFARLRAANIEALREMNIQPDDLLSEGLHPQLGRVNLGQLLSTWVVHDLDHVAQIARTMAKVYTEDVGPWRAYLSVLEDRR